MCSTTFKSAIDCDGTYNAATSTAGNPVCHLAVKATVPMYAIAAHFNSNHEVQIGRAHV